MSITVAAVAFGITTFFSTLVGGYFAIRRKSDLPLFLGFAGGALIGVAFLDLLPGAISINAGSVNYILMSSVIGFMYYHVTQRTLAVHSHNKAIHGGSSPQSQPIMGKIGASGLITHSFFDEKYDGVSRNLKWKGNGLPGFPSLTMPILFLPTTNASNIRLPLCLEPWVAEQCWHF